MYNHQYVYLFGGDKTEGNVKLKNLLGNKGANLAEMNLIGIPVPPGFTITTEVCSIYLEKGYDYVINLIKDEVEKGIKHIEDIMGSRFGDKENPLLLAIRSGAMVSMPGMMDTVLNIGLNDKTLQGLINKSSNERFGWDSYRRFLQMYGDVVMDMVPVSMEEEDSFEFIIEELKEEIGVILDTDLTTNDLKELVARFKATIKQHTGRNFPIDPFEQLWGAISAVFGSWNNKRAILYRKLNKIPHDWGTAVNVQAMVFGNMGDDCATGVAFTRDPATGKKILYGEYMVNAQGEDVVAGIRTPQPINNHTKSDPYHKTLLDIMPAVYRELFYMQQKLENHYKDLQDIEFTIQKNKLWLLQTRTGKRTGEAAVRIALEMLEEGLIDEETAIMRVEPYQLEHLLRPTFDPTAETKLIAKGLAASPGAATGRIVFHAVDAEGWALRGEDVILVRIETSDDDIRGMNVSKGILTERGGMTSHASVHARGIGLCCVAGSRDIRINYKSKEMRVDDAVYKEGDWISLNGSTGEVYDGKLRINAPSLSGNLGKLMKLSDQKGNLVVRANADNLNDAMIARNFGAQGIGLCRTELMFFEKDCIDRMREMIFAGCEDDRRHALDKLLPVQRQNFKDIFNAMAELPVTVRLLDKPLHEFVPLNDKDQHKIAHEMGISIDLIKNKAEELHEFNPMLGHRGCRLGITYPEITELQVRAIFEAALELKKEGVKTFPEILIPFVSTVNEMKIQEKITRKVSDKVFKEKGDKIEYMLGTMIEIPRAALIADEIAKVAEFFSFCTDDLTCMTFGYSREDIGEIIKDYLDMAILHEDPFQVLDQQGVGQLLKTAIKKGSKIRNNLKLGICGEHGGEPGSIKFFDKIGLHYISCSPFRVPVARLAAAQSRIMNMKSGPV